MSICVDINKQLGSFQLDIAFEQDQGVLGLLGASGSGKSKTLQCITGIEKPDEGRIEIDGRLVFDSQHHVNLSVQQRRVGYLFQNYALFPNMTVAENITCGVRAANKEKRRNDIVSEIIGRMHLEGLERQKPAQLSGGQQQRVALARILVNEPDILLLDEPFSALDSYLKEQLMTELGVILRTFQKSVIVVTHSRDEAYQLCSRIAILDKGHLDVIDETKQLFRNPTTCAAARLTGCKNIVAARPSGPAQVYVPDWGITLATGRPVGTGLCAIGIRGHNFSGDLTVNAQDVIIEEEIEQPFEWIVKFRYARQNPSVPALWWRFAKSERPERLPHVLGVEGKNILLLYR